LEALLQVSIFHHVIPDLFDRELWLIFHRCKGPRKFIEEARHFRKLFGGGWRQSGILAAAAKYGIEENFMTGKLVETHENARYLVDTLVAAVPGIKTVNRVDTNMIFLDLRNVISGKVTTVEEIVNEVHRLNEADLERGETDTKIILPTFGYSFDEGDGDFSSDDYVIRLVTHIQQDREGIDLLCNYIRKAV
jgi:threonine aldolase